MNAVKYIKIDSETLEIVPPKLIDEVVTRQKYNVKNILDFNGTLTGSTISTSATDITGYVGTVHLKQNDELVFVCTQDSALAFNTRNTLVIEAPSGDVADRIYEDGAISNDHHNEAGLHIIRFTATQTGDYDFYLWTHTLSSAITYSNFMLCTKYDYDYDSTHQSYAMTNQQLTDGLTTLENHIVSLDGTTKSKGYLTLTYNAIGAQIDSTRSMFIVPLPFICANTNYSITLLSATILLVADVTSDTIVDNKGNSYIRFQVSRADTVGKSFVGVFTFTISF